MQTSERATGAVDILIADDDGFLRASLRLLLEHEGYTCLEAEDGQKAVELARRSLPQCVLLDLAMPGLDGWEVARRLRSDPRTRGAHIHCLTGLSDEVSRRQAREAGCELYLTKPVDIAVLLGVVRGQQARSPVEWVTGLTKAKAEELLDWLEANGVSGELLLQEDGFTVQFRRPPGLVRGLEGKSV